MSTNPTSHAPIKLVKKSTLAGKFATPIKSRTKLSPGRLFVRMPIRENDLVFELGEFTIGLAMTDIDSHIVEKARKRLEKKAEKEAKKAGGSKVGVFGLGGKRGNANDDGGDGTNEGGGVGGLEARDEIETTAENIASHQNAEAIKALEHNDLPKLASLLIQHTSSDDGLITTKTLWSSSPGINFIGATSLSSLEITPGGCMTEQFTQMYPIQTVDNIRRGPAHIITMVGQLAHKIEDGGTLPPNSPVYTLQFILEEESTRALKFVLRVEGGGNHPTGRSGAGTEASSGESGPNKKKLLRGDQLYDYTVNSVQMFVRADMVSTENGREKEAFFGLGGRYSKPNLRGLEVQVCHPSTSCNPGSAGGGDTTTSSASSGEFGGYGLKQTTNPSTLPHFVSSSGISCHLHNVEPTIFDFTNTSWYSIRSPCSNVLSGTFLCAKDMLHAMELHTGMVGRTRPLPKWTQRNGILVGMQGGSFAVQHICRNFFKYKCPLAGILIKDWTGNKATPASTNTNTYGGNGAWYNYVLEREHYTGWQPLVESLERRGISVGLYVTPYLEEIPMVLRSGRRYLFGETKSDYFVKKKTVVKVKNNSSAGDGTKDTKDSAGKKWKSKSKKKESLEVQLSMYEHFKKTNCGMLDFTNYSATSWYKSVLKEEVLDGAGASFWMADMSMGGPPIEGVYTTSLNTGLSHHNNYIEEFAEANRDAIKEAGRDGDSFFIVNSAYGSTAKYAGCTSLGDHVANFHNDTGGILRSILNGIINAGLSGLTHHHCAVNLAVPRQITNAVGNSIDSKSREMICRWLEMTAFTTLFRTHDGDNGINENSGGSAKSSSNTLCAYEDEAVMRALTRWSRVFVALAEYRLQLLNEASFKGHPVVRHPILHFPFDEQFCKQEKKDVGSGNGTVSSSAFMLGDLIYVVPVVKSGVSKKKVYLPEGAWIHLWVSSCNIWRDIPFPMSLISNFVCLCYTHFLDHGAGYRT